MAVKGLIGKWAFVLGIILAIILGIAGTIDATSAWILVVLGLIIGLLNVRAKDVTPFLLAGVSLLLATSFGQAALGSVEVLRNVMMGIMAFVVPGIVVVALREVFVIAKR
jgi:hypothetical protein